MSRFRMYVKICMPVAALVFLLHCASKETIQQVRSEIAKLPPNERIRALNDPKRTIIGKETHIEALAQAVTRNDPVKLEGTGLVINIDNDGGTTNPPRGAKSDVIKALVQHVGFDPAKAGKWVTMPNSAIVRVNCWMDTANRAGDKIDAYLTPIDGSRSLKGGILLPTRLFVIAEAPNNKYGTRFTRAKGFADAEGLVITDPFWPESAKNIPYGKMPRVEQGAKLLFDWNVFSMIPRKWDARFSLFLESLINSKFSQGLDSVVTRHDPPYIIGIRVPDNFMEDWKRFFYILYFVDARVLSSSEAASKAAAWSKELRSDNNRTRYIATCKLTGLGQVGIREIEKALKDPNPIVQLEAATALVPLDRIAVYQPLRAIAKSGNRLQRLMAVSILGRLKTPIGAKFLETLLKDPDSAIIYKAIMGLDRIGNCPQLASVQHKDWKFIKAPYIKRPMIILRCLRPRTIILTGDVRITGKVDLTAGGFRVRHHKGSQVVNYSKKLREIDIRKLKSNSVEDLLDLFSEFSIPFSRTVNLLDKMVKQRAINAQLESYLD